MFVYQISSSMTNKSYVGLTKHAVEVRFAQHVRSAAAGGDTALCKAIRKYGPETFKVSAIDIAESSKQLAYKESFWIKELGTFAPNGYNLTTGGEHTTFALEVRDTMSKAAKERFSSDSEKEKQSNRVKAAWVTHRASLSKGVVETARKTADHRSVKMKAVWGDEKYRSKVIEAQRNGWKNADKSKAVSAAVSRWKNRDSYRNKMVAVITSDGREFESTAACAKALGISQSYVSSRVSSGRPLKNGIYLRKKQPVGIQ